MESKDYKSSIKTVGTVLRDTKLVLEKYLELKDMELLRREVLDSNLILKTSKRRAEIILYELEKRYLYDQLDGYRETPFIYFLKNIDSDNITDFLLYYYLCREERIIYEYIADVVYKRYKNGYLGISSADTVEFILDLAEKDGNVSKWSERTVNDVSSGMIGILKEFGFVNNRKRPIFSKPFIPSIIFYYVLYMNKENIKTIENIHRCRDLRLFLLLENDIHVLLKEAYRNGVLDFEKEEPKNLIYKYETMKEIIDDYVNGEIH